MGRRHMTKAAMGGRAIQQAATRVKPARESKVRDADLPDKWGSPARDGEAPLRAPASLIRGNEPQVAAGTKFWNT